MNTKLITEAIAKLDGYKLDRQLGLWGRGEGSYFILNRVPFAALPDYATSHDACQRVIDGMDDEEVRHEGIYTDLEYFSFHLVNICMPKNSHHKATCPQKCEAILKAHGLWTKEMEG